MFSAADSPPPGLSPGLSLDLSPGQSPGLSIRHANAAQLALALTASRRDTLATFALVQAGLAEQGLQVPAEPTLNLPLWELGHIGWFADWWIARNPQRAQGWLADPFVPRQPARRANADSYFDSSQVEHVSRWTLALPDVHTTFGELALQLAQTQALLADVQVEDDAALYFFRLALLHEDMHHEAALYMAQSLGLDARAGRWQPQPDASALQALHLGAARVQQGAAAAGFAFDNELPAHAQALPAFCIDSRAVNWGEYLPFVDAGGYTNPRWWSAAGRAWLALHAPSAPRDVRRDVRHQGSGWLQRHGPHWLALDPQLVASHLNQFEAQAWCEWAGRRLPTETEWAHAATECADTFNWGQVWEWTASPFAPYPGFAAHPYREYSAPWFDGRPVLRGGSYMTQPRMKNPRYRNYFSAERNDIAAGFRSCAL